MSKFTKKPVIIEATMWKKNGDHPQDNCQMVHPEEGGTTQFEPFLSEGKVVRYFRHPGIPGENMCPGCGYRMHVHGWIDSGGDGIMVCPGDWIITKVDLEGISHYSRCNPDLFKRLYDPVHG